MRNRENGGSVINKFVDGFTPELLIGAEATEKLDGMNVRVTVRSGVSVRLEKNEIQIRYKN